MKNLYCLFVCTLLARCCRKPCRPACRAVAAPVANARLTVKKVDDLGAPMPNIYFILENPTYGKVPKKTDERGFVTFDIRPGANYMLREVQTPAGFIPNLNVWHVTADRRGTVLVNNKPTTTLYVINVRETPEDFPIQPSTAFAEESQTFARCPLAYEEAQQAYTEGPPAASEDWEQPSGGEEYDWPQDGFEP